MNFDYKSIPNIRVVPRSIRKYSAVFDKLDKKVIIDNLRKTEFKQQQILNNVCINAKGVNADEMQKIHKYIVQIIGEETYIKILEDNTENYSLFRSKTSIVATWMFIVLFGIYKNDREMIYLSFISYGIFTYTKMFVKYIPYCSSATFEDAIRITHGLSVYVRIFKKYSHLGIVNFFISEEIKKMINAINQGKYDEVLFSRSFSYIKTRIAQSLRSFGQYYHKVAQQKKNTDDDEGVSSSQLGMMLNQIMNANKQISKIPTQYAVVLNKQLDFDNKLVEDFLNTYTKLIHSDSNFESKVKDFYADVFKIFMSYISKICDASFINALYKITTLKNASAELIDFKRKLDVILVYIVSHMNNKEEANKVMLSKAKITKTRKLLIRMMYFIYMKPALCG